MRRFEGKIKTIQRNYVYLYIGYVHNQYTQGNIK